MSDLGPGKLDYSQTSSESRVFVCSNSIYSFVRFSNSQDDSLLPVLILLLFK